jgi:anaerobic magnesium-protoporphyrin IX monomethyl ester cyclase
MSKLDILLINPGERGKIYQDLGADLTAIEPPLWCRILGGYVRDRGWSTAILDAEAENIDTVALAERSALAEPRLIVLVVYGHQPSASTQRMVGARFAAVALKARLPDVPILIVGGHIAALPLRTLEDEPVDFACNSEGPVTLHQLMAQIASPTPDFAKVEGLVWRNDRGEIVNNPAPALIKELDADLHGDVWDLLPVEKYRAHNWQCFGDLKTRQPYASIYTSLGCPFKCSFCCINAPFGVNRYRMRSARAVGDEIEKLYRTYGVKTFKIVDEMFVLNDRHVTAICENIAARKLEGLNIWAYARVDTVKAGMLPLLRSAGIRWLALGIESGSAHVRDGAEKSFDQSEIYAIVRQIQDADINVIGNFIFGLPDDDMESMTATLKMARELNCEFANFYSAMAYPGSPLYGMAIENGWALPESWSGYSQHSYDCTPLPTEKLSSAEILLFRDRAFQEYFGDSRYLSAITQKFGWETRRHIEDMVSKPLPRRLFSADRIGQIATAIESR